MPPQAMMDTLQDVLQSQSEELALLCDVGSIIEQMKVLSRTRGANVEALAEAHVAEVDRLKKEHAAEVERMKQQHETEVRGLKEEHSKEVEMLQRALSAKDYALRRKHEELVRRVERPVNGLAIRQMPIDEATQRQRLAAKCVIENEIKNSKDDYNRIMIERAAVGDQERRFVRECQDILRKAKAFICRHWDELEAMHTIIGDDWPIFPFEVREIYKMLEDEMDEVCAEYNELGEERKDLEILGSKIEGRVSKLEELHIHQHAAHLEGLFRIAGAAGIQLERTLARVPRDRPVEEEEVEDKPERPFWWLG